MANNSGSIDELEQKMERIDINNTQQSRQETQHVKSEDDQDLVPLQARSATNDLRLQQVPWPMGIEDDWEMGQIEDDWVNLGSEPTEDQDTDMHIISPDETTFLWSTAAIIQDSRHLDGFFKQSSLHSPLPKLSDMRPEAESVIGVIEKNPSQMLLLKGSWLEGRGLENPLTKVAGQVIHKISCQQTSLQA